jgi:hypothetical protein
MGPPLALRAAKQPLTSGFPRSALDFRRNPARRILA